MLRDSRDVGAAIISAVQELNARHLVLAVPTASVFERWRGSLLERLAGQLPRVHLHIEAAAGRQPDDAGNDGVEVSGRAQQHRRGAIRVYLGYAPGCGTTTAMLEEANRRRSRGTDVVVGAVDAPEREDIAAEIEHLELIGDGTVLDTAAVLARRPEVVCIDDLTAGTASAERRFAAARHLADAGITVIGTVQLAELAGGGPAALLDEAGLLALADEIELVDVSPTILRDRIRRGETVPPAEVEHALETTFALTELRAERERAFRIVAEHGERQLAAYAGAPDDLASLGVADAERRPSILACAAPLPGMERLIRRAAALAAQVAGDFRVATVRLSEPGGGEDQLLAGYMALTEQLGGEFAVLTGPVPAPALAAYASQHQVTELVLNRAQPNPAGRYPVLRELARLVHDAELHVLPVDR
jgi:two-component system, OmpR family, sensor histidine kinase KdpD